MSLPHKMAVSCPRCKKQFETTVFESLNTEFATDIVESVISGDRFNAKCPHCGFVAHLEYDLLFHDIEHRAMIWVLHKNNPEYSSKVAELRATPLLPYDVTRIVYDMNALREKAACLASEKDDRIIELCKVFLASEVNQQRPNFEIEHVFYTYQNGHNIVFFYDNNGKEIKCELEDKIYDMISALFSEPLSKMEKSSFSIIDESWAMDFYKYFPDNNKMWEVFSNLSENDNASKIENISTCSHIDSTPTKKALFCRKCGAKLLPDSQFCSYCGTKVVY